MNMNLMNPEIVTRSAIERERNMRREASPLREAEILSERPAPRKGRAQKPRHNHFFAWLYASLIR